MMTLRVMLVDDNSAFLAAATRFLSSLEGVDVVASVTCAAEALAQAVALRPDLILMDLVMPGMSGLQAVSLLKQGAGAPRTVILTLHNTEAYRGCASKAGADGFLSKDKLVPDLPALLESLFPGWRA